MKMERLPVTMPSSTAKAFRQYARAHDIDQCVVAKIAITDYCRETPAQEDLMQKGVGEQERVFINIPDTAMRLLEFWSEETGINKRKLMEWSIRRLAGDEGNVKDYSEEDNEE